MVQQNILRPVLRNVLRSPGDRPFGGFLPSQLPNLEAWFRYNKGINITGSGVSQWDDRSGNSRHLLQASDTNRPLPGSLGSDVAVNGDFATDTDWNKGTGWSIAAGVANCDGSQSAGTNLRSNTEVVIIGKSYFVTYTISNYVAGQVRSIIGNSGLGTYNSANGTFTEVVVASSTSEFIFLQGDVDFNGDVDDFIVEPIDPLAGVLFNGVDNFLKASAFTLNQPETVYILGRQVTYASGDRIFDGDIGNSMGCLANGVTPEIELYAGNFSGKDSNFAVNTYAVLITIFNGVSSLIQVDTNTPTTGDAGANNAGGFILGARTSVLSHSNIQVKEVAIYSAAHDATIRTQMIDYLNSL